MSFSGDLLAEFFAAQQLRWSRCAIGPRVVGMAGEEIGAQFGPDGMAARPLVRASRRERAARRKFGQIRRACGLADPTTVSTAMAPAAAEG